MSVRQAPKRNFAEYTAMLEESHTRLMQIESHLKDLVYVTKRTDARQYESTRRIVEAINDDPSGGGAILRFKPPQGEAWEIEKIFVSGMAATTQGYLYLGAAISHNVAGTFTSDANGFFADVGKRHLFVPERVDLIVIAATGARAQIRVIKQYTHSVSSEEAYALHGPESEYEEHEIAERPAHGTDSEPDPGRHTKEEEGGMGFVEPDVRPTPHFPQIVERAINAVEHTFADLV